MVLQFVQPQFVELLIRVDAVKYVMAIFKTNICMKSISKAAKTDSKDRGTQRCLFHRANVPGN